MVSADGFQMPVLRQALNVGGNLPDKCQRARPTENKRRPISISPTFAECCFYRCKTCGQILVGKNSISRDFFLLISNQQVYKTLSFGKVNLADLQSTFKFSQSKFAGWILRFFATKNSISTLKKLPPTLVWQKTGWRKLLNISNSFLSLVRVPG